MLLTLNIRYINNENLSIEAQMCVFCTNNEQRNSTPYRWTHAENCNVNVLKTGLSTNLHVHKHIKVDLFTHLLITWVC